jgi:hypothetical protein
MMPLTGIDSLVSAGEIITMSHNHDSAAAMIQSRVRMGETGGADQGIDHRARTAEVVYRIATMTAVIFLLFSVL